LVSGFWHMDATARQLGNAIFTTVDK